MYNQTWYQQLHKSCLTPPNWIFGIIWPILYILLFISVIKIWTHKQCQPYCRGLIYFFIQLTLNLVWTTIFFKYKQIKLALVCIGFIFIMTVLTYHEFKQIDITSSYLLIPYMAWLLFAFYLNLYIVINN